MFYVNVEVSNPMLNHFLIKYFSILYFMPKRTLNYELQYYPWSYVTNHDVVIYKQIGLQVVTYNNAHYKILYFAICESHTSTTKIYRFI